MKTIHGMSVVDFDRVVARKFCNKMDSAKTRNLEFNLSFAQFRALYTRTNCAYTGIPMVIGIDSQQANNELTVERVNNLKGYVAGNVIAVCKAANSIKSVFEDPSTFLTVENAIRMFAKINELTNKVK